MNGVSLQAQLLRNESNGRVVYLEVTSAFVDALAAVFRTPLSLVLTNIQNHAAKSPQKTKGTLIASMDTLKSMSALRSELLKCAPSALLNLESCDAHTGNPKRKNNQNGEKALTVYAYSAMKQDGYGRLYNQGNTNTRCQPTVKFMISPALKVVEISTIEAVTFMTQSGVNLTDVQTEDVVITKEVFWLLVEQLLQNSKDCLTPVFPSRVDVVNGRSL